jgi:hypothetical protein
MAVSTTSGNDTASGGEAAVSRSRLWLGLVLAPAAWLIGEQLGYYATARGCEMSPGGVPLPRPSHPAATVLVIEIVAASLAAIGLLIAVRSWRATRFEDDAAKQAASGRAHFMAFTGMIASALFLLGIVWFGFPAIVVDACNQAR